jgi:hypothetical protein
MPQIERIRYSHEAMIEKIIADPWVSQNELAAMFGYTPAWVSTIMSSDAFQAKLAERRAEVVDPRLAMAVDERFRAVASKAFDVMMERLENQPSDNLVIRAAEMGARVIAARVANTAPREPVGDRLSRLAERLLQLNPQPTLELTPTAERTSA